MKKKYVMILGLVIVIIAVFKFNIYQLLGFIPIENVEVSKQTLFHSRLYFWGIAIFLFLYAHFAENQHLFLKISKPRGIRFYVLSFVGILAAIFVSSIFISLILKFLGYAINENGSVINNMLTVFKENPLLLLFTCITAGITEEIIFRGYIQQRAEMIFNSPLGGIIFSSILFGLAHVNYGTAKQLLIPFAIGLIFSIYYYRFKKIYVLMIFHFLFDYTQIMLLMYGRS